MKLEQAHIDQIRTAFEKMQSREDLLHVLNQAKPINEKYDWNLALDRILSITEIKGRYQKNNKSDWSEYFEDIIGVTKTMDGEVENITLYFYGKTGKYIESKPIHGSQKSKWIDQNTLEVSLQLIVNYEFERLILSYGDSVKVIKPNGLSGSIKKRLEIAYGNY